MAVLFCFCLLLASSWAYCPPPGQLGPCAQRCGPAPGPGCAPLPPPYPPPPQGQGQFPYPQGGQLPYPQPQLYPGAYYQPKPMIIKETAVIRRPSTSNPDLGDEEFATAPPRPYDESTEASSEVLRRPDPVPLYPQGPRESPLPSGYAQGPREYPLIPPQPLPLPPQQPYPGGCGNLPYPPGPGRPIYPPQPIQPQPGGYPYPPQPYLPRPPYPQPQPLPYPPRPPFPTNDCCGRCSAPCRYKNRHVRAYDAKHLSSKAIAAANDPKCTSDKLKAILKKNMVANLTIAKRLIQKSAEEKFGGAFNVICSRDDFTYVSRSSQFCLLEHNGLMCYAFQS